MMPVKFGSEIRLRYRGVVANGQTWKYLFRHARKARRGLETRVTVEGADREDCAERLSPFLLLLTKMPSLFITKAADAKKRPRLRRCPKHKQQRAERT